MKASYFIIRSALVAVMAVASSAGMVATAKAGGRGRIDVNGNNVVVAEDLAFMCPLLGLGRSDR